MRARELARMKGQLERLTRSQRRALAANLAALENREASIEVIESGTYDQLVCPHCSGEHVVKNGSARKLQRFMCRSCCRTFNALTGTPLSHLRCRDRWPEYAKALLEGLTLSQAAERVGINIKTAFLWRHRFMALPKTLMAQTLTGVAEIDETYFLRSNKGQRHGLDRAPRHRGGKATKRGLSGEQVPVLVARDRSGATADFILESNDADHIVKELKPILPKDAVLCTEGNPVMMAAGRKLAVEHHAVNVAAGVRVDGPWHVQNVNAYHSRLKEWMRRFKGVATKYLDSYLGWFRLLSRSPGFLPEPAPLLAMAIRG